jgi:diguanylate cyclase (GGDEF)-like protein
MKLLDGLKPHAESGIKNAISKAIELAIITGGTALGGYILTFMAAYVSSVSPFWTSKRFALSDLVIWSLVTAIAAVLITFSFMRSKVSNIERKAKETTQTDPLTGLPNLRALNDEFPKAMEKARKDQQPLTMVIFDIDGFKEINTLVGHDIANQILRDLAAVLPPRGQDKLFRHPENVGQKTSMAFRYGGDEFIVLAFNTTVIGGTDVNTGITVANGAAMAKSMQRRVWDIENPHLANKRRERNQPPRITVSAGVADCDPCRDPGDIKAALTSRAELALIDAKRRNKEMTTLDDAFKGTVVSYDGDEYRLH